MTPHHLRRPIAHLAHALRPFLSAPDRGATSAALEVARNVAHVLQDGTEDPHQTIEEMLVHRHRNGWLRVADLRLATWLGACAWERAVGAERRAA